MSGNRFVMRRDTQKHMPPKPGAHPHPVMPPRPRPPRRDGGEAPRFWKEEERRHATPEPPGPPAHENG